jgi:hypothetical protein
MSKKDITVRDIVEGWEERSFKDVKASLRPEILQSFDLPEFAQFGLNLVNMANFYSFLRPLVLEVQPKKVCEIGSNEGHSTKAWLDICRESGAEMHVVDPILPASGSETVNGVPLTNFSAMSIDYLAAQTVPADVYFLDGDHNYYTLHKELTMIRDLARRSSSAMPLLILHDTSWPCNKRDSFYDLSNIPAEGRSAPLDESDLSLFVEHELAECGFNSRQPWSIPKTHPNLGDGSFAVGLEAAVDDFLKSNPEMIRVAFPSLFGVTVLFDSKRAAQSEAFKRLQAIEMTFEPFLRILELNRLFLLERSQYLGEKAHHFSNRVRDLWESSSKRNRCVDTAAVAVKLLSEHSASTPGTSRRIFAGSVLTHRFILKFLHDQGPVVQHLDTDKFSAGTSSHALQDQLKELVGDAQSGMLIIVEKMPESEHLASVLKQAYPDALLMACGS